MGEHRPGRKRLVRICVTCGTPFRTVAYNRECSSCINARRRHPCAGCGTPVDRRAKRCLRCAPVVTGGQRRGSGRYVNKSSGYAFIRVDDHPRAGSNGYVREHVWVMEQMIGRYLLPGEEVHHKNGVRDDNRPTNLELWVKRQPSGQRAADLLEWAREIIATYEPIEEMVSC